MAEFRNAWAEVKALTPLVAWQAGPPNRMVVERQRKGETFLEAAARVKREEFPGGYREVFLRELALMANPETRRIAIEGTENRRPIATVEDFAEADRLYGVTKVGKIVTKRPSVTKSVTKKGRPKKYSSAAERQKAYRAKNRDS